MQVKEAGLEPNIIALSDYGVDTYEDLIFTTDSMVKDHADVVRRHHVAA